MLSLDDLIAYLIMGIVCFGIFYFVFFGDKYIDQNRINQINENKIIENKIIENCDHEWVTTSKYNFWTSKYKIITKCTKCGKEIE